MKFTIKKYVLESLLIKAGAVLTTKSDFMPILKNFFIQVTDKEIKIVATDLQLSVMGVTELVEVAEAGTAVFPGKKFLDIVKACDDGIVEVSVKDVTVTITCGATWTIQLMDSTDYPEFPVVEGVIEHEIARLPFINALAKVKGAAAKDSVRPNLQVINIQACSVMASDGAVLRQVFLEDLGELEIQIPLGAVEDLIKVLKSAEIEKTSIGQTEDHIIFKVGTDVFLITKENVEYPDVINMLIEPARKNKYKLVIEKQSLFSGVKRIAITSDEGTKGVLLSITSNKLTLKSKDKYGNTSIQEIDCLWEHSPRDVGINYENFIDGIQAMDTPILTILLGDDTKTRKAPLLLEFNNQLALLQQLRLEV